MWRLGIIEELFSGVDGTACVRVISETGQPITLRCLIQLIYPLEVNRHETPEECEEQRQGVSTEVAYRLC